MFRKLLNRSDQIKLATLENLYEADSYFLEELSIKLKQSPVLIKKYIDEVNEDMDFVEIIISKNHVVSLQISSYQSINSIYSYFLENALAFELLGLLFYKTYSSSELLATDLAVSKSTVVRLIKQVNHCLEELDFRIETKPIQITGNEKSITQFYTIFFIEKNRGTDFPNKESLAQAMKELSFYLNQVFPISPYFADVQTVAITLYVLSIRTRMNKPEENFSMEGKTDLLEQLGWNELLKKETGPHVQNIIEKILSHPFMNSTFRNQIDQELRSVFKQVFDQFNYTAGEIQIHFHEIVFQYMIGVNLDAHYCILNDRLSRFKKSKTGPFNEYFTEYFIEKIKNSSLPGKEGSHVDNLLYLFDIYFPDFKETVICRLKPMEIALFFDSNIVHVQAIKKELARSISASANLSIVNPLDRFTSISSPEVYDLIIGNIGANEAMIEKGAQKYLCTDLYLTSKDWKRLENEIEEHAINQIKILDSYKKS